MALTYRSLALSPYEGETDIAVAVSGGPDSMALAWLLHQWAQGHDINLHILTVDHALRAESAEEARQVGKITAGWPGVQHHILVWEGEKPEARLLEEARRARYGLLSGYCEKHGIRYLFLAHHQDDQAETFLFRLAKGSGLDGLAAMQRTQILDDVTLVRPLLDTAKQDLVDLCIAENIPFVRDPTNEKTDYARPRLRAARAVLEEEGLTSKRLATTAMRLSRAREAFEAISDIVYEDVAQTEATGTIVLMRDMLHVWPEEIVLRVLSKAMAQIRGTAHSYPPRLEKVEDLVREWLAGRLTKTTTLGGCLFVPDDEKGLLSLKAEA